LSPRNWLDPEHLHPVQFVTSMFLHAGLWHLMGNMLFLWVYGVYVEERLGPWKFLGVYFAAGFVGSLFYLGLGNGVPCVGASGAISGLMGFTLIAAPWSEVRMFFMLHERQFADPNLKSTFTLPVWFLLGMWLVFQWVLGARGGTNVAVAAHLGGFALGAGVAAFLRSAQCRGTSWYLEPAPASGGPAATRRLKKARLTRRSVPAEEEPTRRHEVVLHGLTPEASPVAVIKLLMKHCFLSPEIAKERVDAIQASEPQPFAFDTQESAAAFREDADDVGALCRL